MDIKIVKQLAELMEKHNLNELSISEEGHSITLGRSTTPAQPVEVAQPAPAPVAVPQPVPAPAPVAAPAVAAVESGEALTAPLVGVAYRAASPDAAPFVQVGQAVLKGQTLCILEAMKVMNEFTCPRDGVIQEICFENEALVEFGQCLFRLQ